MKGLIQSLLLGGLSTCAIVATQSAALTEGWVHRFDGPAQGAQDQASHVVCDGDGNVIVTGTTDAERSGKDFLTLKYSGSDGTLVWQQRYDDSAHLDDVPTALAVDLQGNVFVTGYTTLAGNGSECYTAKYGAADGALIWERHYRSATTNSRPRALAVDTHGDVVVTGYSANLNAGSDYYTVKYEARSGDVLWEKRYGGSIPGVQAGAYGVALDADGNALVTGTRLFESITVKYSAKDGTLLWEHPDDAVRSGLVAVDAQGNAVVSGMVGDYYTDISTIKYAAADGRFLWRALYAGIITNGYDRPTALAVDYRGNVVLAGNSSNGTNYDYYTVKYAASTGARLWERRYNGPANLDDYCYGIAVDAVGNVVVTGISYNYPNSSSDYYTAKYAAADGALLWERRYGGIISFLHGAQGIAVDIQGDIVVTGYCNNIQRNADYYTAKYAGSTGAPLWEQRHNGLVNKHDIPRALTMDQQGNVIVTGYTDSTIGQTNYYTAKYAAEDGTLLWDRFYNGPANGSDFAESVVVDNRGDVVVTGTCFGSFGNYDYCTLKYAGADGALLWERRYNGTGNEDDVPAGLVVDSAGDIVVTGSSAQFNLFWDYYTAKYASAGGALIWERRYNGQRGWDDVAQAVALDPEGNAVVTGYSQNMDGQSDYYTTKYAAADGAILWEQRYHGPAITGHDYARAVAVDSSGNVVVTGQSSGWNLGFDYYTAKYAAADGALLWEKRYDGPSHGDDVPTGLALDARGDAVVTGWSTVDDGRGYEFYTVKYAGTDGSILWDRRYNELKDSINNRAAGLAVDGNGDVVVTGESSVAAPSRGGIDYYTAKYSGTDGSLRWEMRYNGIGNGEDHIGGPHAIATGPRNSVAITGYSDGKFGPGVPRFDYATILYRELRPTLTIRWMPPESVLISWPLSAAAFQLQYTDDLAAASWQDVLTPVVIGTDCSVTVTVPGPRWFRLRE